ncbi:MAG: potassium transporter TrkH [Rhodobacterales bacterium CG18_big_fil_WC_8_21_14_2_50_71_9]|nr:MAG: potassium transporter TrkH [Rhodobacterales bacterium CG18_big_fil_WC_8_21_14_2_50_71_9]
MTWRGLPVMALALLAVAALMLPPAVLALIERDLHSARAFSQSAGVVGMIGVAFALARRGHRSRTPARSEIVTVLFMFTVAPLAAALPVLLTAPQLGAFGAYFEMVSSFTTTGATALPSLEAAPRALHLWRAMTAWFGGFAALTAAVAVFAPRNLGGYEVQAAERRGPVGRLGGGPSWSRSDSPDEGGARLARAVSVVAPVYAGLTLALALIFAALGMPGLRAAIHAIGIMSTSGVSMDGGGFRSGAGAGAEVVALAFLTLAASRHVFAAGSRRGLARRLRRDPELELALIAVAVAAGWIFIRHWLHAADAAAPGGDGAWVRAAWGAVFTAASFLSTTGYVSDSWTATETWSGSSGAGLLFLALATMGGGVASTAGGVKLLRAYALYQHGMRELDTLSKPSLVARKGAGVRRVGFAGAVLAWLFVMLYALGVCTVVLGLSVTGAPLDQAFAAAIAAIANTGPAYAMALGAGAAGFSDYGAAGQLILCFAMVLGRVEILAVVALTNPDYWRR